MEHSQNDRILDAVATIVASDGLDALTIRSLATSAEISSKAFYTHFASLDEAFAATLLAGARSALAAALPATLAPADWREGVTAGLGALLELFSEEPAFAHVALIGALAFGVQGAALQGEALDTLAATLANAYERGDVAVAAIVPRAVAAAAFELCADRVRRGRGGRPCRAGAAAVGAGAGAGDRPGRGNGLRHRRQRQIGQKQDPGQRADEVLQGSSRVFAGAGLEHVKHGVDGPVGGRGLHRANRRRVVRASEHEIAERRAASRSGIGEIGQDVRAAMDVGDERRDGVADALLVIPCRSAHRRSQLPPGGTCQSGYMNVSPLSCESA